MNNYKWKFGRKLSTAVHVFRRSSFKEFLRVAGVSLRRMRLERSGGRPFIYLIGGMKFVCFPDLPDSCELYVQRCVDFEEEEIMRVWLRPGDVVVDAGANVGIYTWRAHHFLSGKGFFIAIDGSRRICDYLGKCAEMTGIVDQIRVCNLALGDEEKVVGFFEALPGAFSAEQGLRPNLERHRMAPTKIQMTTFENVCSQHFGGARPAVVKVDIEGAEAMALRGAPKDWFAGSGPLWIVEINSTALERFGASPGQIIELFPDARFQRVLFPKFPKTGGFAGSPRLLRDDDPLSDAWFYNLAAIPRRSERWHAYQRTEVKQWLGGES